MSVVEGHVVNGIVLNFSFFETINSILRKKQIIIKVRDELSFFFVGKMRARLQSLAIQEEGN